MDALGDTAQRASKETAPTDIASVPASVPHTELSELRPHGWKAVRECSFNLYLSEGRDARPLKTLVFPFLSVSCIRLSDAPQRILADGPLCRHALTASACLSQVLQALSSVCHELHDILNAEIRSRT